jgi:hypothetical protein
MVVFGASVLLVTGCGGSASSGGAGRDGTIRGQVLTAPTCPVERPGSPCPPGPAVRVQVVATSDDGGVRVRTRTDEHGTFTLHVRPGHYRVVATGGIGSTDSAMVDLPASGAVTVQLMLDSGIR